MFRFLSLVLLLGSATLPLRAQDSPLPLEPGSRVRVTLAAEDSARITGDFLTMDWRGVVIEHPVGPSTRRWNAVRLVEVSRGRSRSWTALRRGSYGAFVGMAAGTIAGALLAKELPTSTGESMILGGVGLGMIGGGIGSGLGLIYPYERWEPYVRGGPAVVMSGSAP